MDKKNYFKEKRKRKQKQNIQTNKDRKKEYIYKQEKEKKLCLNWFPASNHKNIAPMFTIFVASVSTFRIE